MGSAVKPIGLLALPFIGIIWAGQRAGFWDRVSKWVLTAIIGALTFVGLGLISQTGLG